jgi:hypothetical protein
MTWTSSLTFTANNAAFLSNLTIQNPILRSTPPYNVASPRTEKDLLRWAQCNPAQPVGSVQYSHLDVDVNRALPIDEYNALRQAGADFATVFDAAKGSRGPKFQTHMETR